MASPGGTFGPCSSISKTRSPITAPRFVLNVQDLTIDAGVDASPVAFADWMGEQLRREKQAFAAELETTLAGHLTDLRESCVNELRARSKMQLLPAASKLPVSERPATQPLPKFGISGRSDTSPGASEKEAKKMQEESAKEARKVVQNQASKALENLNKMHDFEIDHELHHIFVKVQHLVQSHLFEIISMIAVILNTLMLALEIQYTGIEAGYFVNYDGYENEASVVWPGAAEGFKWCTLLFNSFFAVELVLRLIAMRTFALRSSWIWIDMVLVPLGLYDILYTFDMVGGFGFNPTMLRVVRLARLMRLARTMKGRDSFHSLFLLVKSIRASVTALVWSLLLLFFVMLASSMIVDQVFNTYIMDPSHPLDVRQSLFQYFGTFTRTLFTFFEITFGNWVPPTRLVLVTIGEGFSALFVIYKCVFAFALINVIRAVFITETNRVASNDDEVALMVRENTTKSLNRQLDNLFRALDHSGDGNIDWVDFEQGMNDPTLKRYMALLDIDFSDMKSLFSLLDNGDGQVDWQEFSSSVKRLRGSARSLDMTQTLRYIRKVDVKLDHVIARLAVPAEGQR
eukprot:TRINITY_DN29684_c0_g2_i1.p1 TRINITY_DN29684_c0_g2~~TRINITY_DN29684_c0_g2_i1.p1  ORF type:complete len:572 (+),score=99.99 TRINITY_DN29684_c0_g2_i1:86-1801(+)